MIIKAIWISLMFVCLVGFLFLASFGFPVKEAYYESEEIIVFGYE